MEGRDEDAVLADVVEGVTVDLAVSRRNVGKGLTIVLRVLIVSKSVFWSALGMRYAKQKRRIMYLGPQTPQQLRSSVRLRLAVAWPHCGQVVRPGCSLPGQPWYLGTWRVPAEQVEPWWSRFVSAIVPSEPIQCYSRVVTLATGGKYPRVYGRTYILALPAASPPLNTLKNAAPYSTPCTARFAAPIRFATA